MTLINKLRPEHDYVTCSDIDPAETARCVRCHLLGLEHDLIEPADDYHVWWEYE